MTWFPYRRQAAWNSAGSSVQAGSGAVYAVDDVGFTTPLVTRHIGAGAVMATIAVSSFLCEEFEVEDQVEVYWKSGSQPPVHLISAKGMADATAAAAASAATSATAAETAAAVAYGPADATVAALVPDTGTDTGAAVADTIDTLTGMFRADGLGAVGDGTTDNSTVIAAALVTAAAADRVLFFPPGVYLLGSSVDVPAGARVEVAPGASFTFAVSPAFDIVGSNVSFRGGQFVSASSTVVAFGINNAVDNVVLTDFECVETRAVTRTGVSTYAAMTDDTWARGVRVARVTAVATTPNTATCINMRYVSGVQVTDCSVQGYYHGISWWGGDANPGSDGDTANERRAQDITISGCIVRDVTKGGIWGSMGERVTVTGCVVKNCGDVGIDAEGSNDVTISGNTVSDCDNGGITTFFLNRNVTISGNSVSALGDEPAIKVYNSNSNNYGSNTGIVIVGNTVRGLTDDTPTILSVQSCTNLLIASNALTNCRIEVTASSGNFAGVTVQDNLLSFPTDAAAAFNAIEVTRARLRWGHAVSRNRVFSTGTQPTGSVAIRVVSDDPNNSPAYLADGNQTHGFETDLSALLGGTNSGQFPRLLVRNNVFQPTPVVAITYSGAYTGQVRWEGNRSGTLLPYPLAVPTALGKWAVGQIIHDDDPAAAGTIGWVCTTAGWTGTTAWVLSTAYAVGDIRTNDSGKVYACTTAGTSASSGGPTGTSTSISDGTVTWRYVGVAAVFKTFATIAA